MRYLILVTYLIWCTSVWAVDAKSSNVKALEQSKPITQAELIDAALRDVRDLEALLDRAESAALTAKTELAQSSTELSDAKLIIKNLQEKITKSTNFIETLRDSLNTEIAEAESWRTQYKEVLAKLWFWRKIALSITGGFALYIIVLVLKATGKLS